MYFKEYLEKVAFSDVDKEKELIKRYQKTKNKIDLLKLERMFKGTINTAVARSETIGIPDNILKQKTRNIFKKAIENYDPNKGMKPSAHIHKQITLYLKKESVSLRDTTRSRDSITEIKNLKRIAEKDLEQRGIDIKSYGSIEEQAKVLRDNMENLRYKPESGKKPNPYNIKDIEMAIRTDRTSLSGDVSLGGDDGETIFTQDLFNVSDDDSISLDSQYNKDRLMQNLNILTPQERGVYTDVKGLFGKPKEQSWENVALNNNLGTSGYKAQKIYKRAVEKLEKQMKL